MLSEAFLSELKYRCDIESVVSRYVSLKRRGKVLTGLCPFHLEKTPSFTVYPETQSFYCFGCGAGGDVITFIKKIENLEYMDAVRMLAEQAGIDIPDDTTDDKTKNRRLRMLEMNRLAGRFFYDTLMSDTGRYARSYLVERGLSKKIINRFGIGYADSNHYSLVNYLNSKGYDNDEINDAYLGKKAQKGYMYDVFIDRIMFPIIDLRGGIIGFGGRRLGENGPKYLNSSDTYVYKKSKNLFALNIAKNTKRDELILCEGYMDVVSLHQAGFDNAVATLGTALTDEQARLISTYTSNAVLSYDSDEAGQKATRRAVDIFDRTGIKTKILSIPNAKDPDEFIKKFGADKFDYLLKNTNSSTEYEIEKLFKTYNIDDPEQKIEFLQKFVSLMVGISNPIRREVYIGDISQKLSTEKSVIMSQVNMALKKKHSYDNKKEINDIHTFIESSPSTKGDFEKQKYPKEALASERLIGYLWNNPDRLNYLKDRISVEHIVSEINRELFTAVTDRIADGYVPDIMSLGGKVSDTAMSRISEILSYMNDKGVTDADFEEYISLLQIHKDSKSKQDIGNLSDEDFEDYLTKIAKSKM